MKRWTPTYSLKRPEWRLRGTHLNILADLYESNMQGKPWVEMRIDARMAQKLANLDMLVASPDRYSKKTAYKITLRGMSALMEADQLRDRDTCLQCGVEPKHVTPSGRRRSLCRACYHAYQNARYELTKIHHSDEPCIACGKRERAVGKTGAQYIYCRKCINKKAAKSRRRRWRVLRREIEAGAVILCPNCKMRPVTVHPHTIGRLCRDCQREMERRTRHNRRLRIIKRAASAITRKRGSDAAD